MKTMCRLFPLLILLISFFSTTAQNRVTDTSATCIAYWNNKETKTYQIKHRKEKYDQSKETSASEANYEAHIKILDSAATGFTVEWIYKNFSTGGSAEYTLNSLNAIMEGMKVIYRTDELGLFSELINWKEISEFAVSNYEKAVSSLSQDKQFVAALNQIKSIFQSKENTEALLIKEVQLYHMPYGVEYTFSGSVMETEIPNVTGGQPFPAAITLKLDELNTEKEYCRVSLNQSIDKGKAGPIIAAMLKKLSGSGSVKEAEISSQIKDMEITDVNEFTYSVPGGWISRVYFKRTSNVGERKQIETYEITEKN